MTTPSRPITILIAALGGEGGGVLTNWIVSAAQRQGFPVQSTSIPGVAQRTGATTYYIEIVPLPWRELGERRAVLALAPGIGDVDLVVASELMEAGRCVADGFVTRDRTSMIASSNRSYLVVEKIAMADGRYDQERLLKAVADNAKDVLLLDLDELSKQSGAMVNAVMLGTIAGSAQLPIPVDAFEAAIRHDAKAVESNLRGFRAGLEAARAGARPQRVQTADKRSSAGAISLAALEQDSTAMPALARDIVIEGARRLATYQDLAYARLYFDRLAAIRDADARANAGGKLLRETARHLAVRMSYEDVIRVAEAKIDPGRLARIEKEMGVKPGEPYIVVEFLKPGIEEMCQVLPVWLARAILNFSERRGWLQRVHWGMQINSTSVLGYLRFLMLAKLKRWRPKSYRFHEEQAAIASWLRLIVEAAKVSPELALEVAECARLIKGYGDTHKRGTGNYREIETRVILPALAGRMPARAGADAVASARTAALVDPEGESLKRCLAEIERQASFSIAAE
jgi:indolepyruvate ferredoxin oxidoreductase, beta subunit